MLFGKKISDCNLPDLLTPFSNVNKQKKEYWSLENLI